MYTGLHVKIIKIIIRSYFWSKYHLFQILFLIGMALREERRTFDAGDLSFSFVAKASRGDDDVSAGGGGGGGGATSLLAKLEETLSQNLTAHQGQRDLLAWVLKVAYQFKKKINQFVNFLPTLLESSNNIELSVKTRHKTVLTELTECL